MCVWSTGMYVSLYMTIRATDAILTHLGFKHRLRGVEIILIKLTRLYILSVLSRPREVLEQFFLEKEKK